MKQEEFYPEESRRRKSRKTVCSVHGSMFLFCRLKTRIFTIIELLMRKSCKSGISFREQQGSAGRCQSPDLTSPFLVRLFSGSFFLPCSLFDILTSQGENTDFHPDRAPYRDSDHFHSCGDAAPRPEQGKRCRTENFLPEQCAPAESCRQSICFRFSGLLFSSKR